MPEYSCGAHIVPDFARIFDDNNDISACIECARLEDIRGGGDR